MPAPRVAVAAPNAPVAFPLPVEGPTRVVPKQFAASAAPVKPAPPPPAGPQKFVPDYGSARGQQAKPPYPRDALLNRQQGVVALRFTVDAEGRVATVEIEQGCPHRVPK